MWAWIAAAVILLVAVAAIWSLRQRRQRDEIVIRRWADEQGYAVLDVQGPMLPLAAALVALCTELTNLLWWRATHAGALSYPVSIQDGDGAQITFEVTVRPHSKSIEARRI